MNLHRLLVKVVSDLDGLNLHVFEPRVRQHLIKVYSTFTMAVISAAIGCFLLHAEMINIYCQQFLGIIFSSLWLWYTSNDGVTDQSKRLFVFIFCWAFLIGGFTRPWLMTVWNIDPMLVVKPILCSLGIFVSLTLSILFSPSNAYSTLIALTVFLLVSQMFLMVSFLVYPLMESIYTVNLYYTLSAACLLLIAETFSIVKDFKNGDRDYILHCFKIFLDFIRIIRIALKITYFKNIKIKKKAKNDDYSSADE